MTIVSKIPAIGQKVQFFARGNNANKDFEGTIAIIKSVRQYESRGMSLTVKILTTNSRTTVFDDQVFNIGERDWGFKTFDLEWNEEENS